MKPCSAPFCPNPMYFNKKYYTYCTEHLAERAKYKVKAYKEVLPLWAFKRCKVHGLLNFDQVYIREVKGKLIGYHCKKCTKTYINKHYDPAKAKIQNAKKAAQKRNRELKCIYGITLDDYHTLLKSQNYACAICQTTEISNIRKSFDVDHCHTTKKVRGLLCHACNVGIGFLKDDIQLLQKAISYLSAFKKGGTATP